MTFLDWTEEDRKNWERSWNADHMQKGLMRLKLSCVPNGSATPVVAGVDVGELASQSYAHLQGKASMFTEIEALMPIQRPKDIGKPFQRGTPPPKPADETPRPEPKD